MLKNEFERELNLSRVPGRSDLAEGTAGEGFCRIIEVRPVKQVEELGAELQPHALGNRNVLEYRKVKAKQAGTAHRKSTQVPIYPTRSPQTANITRIYK